MRPADPSVLEGRPLLDLGTGDGQSLEALVGGGPGLVVGLDRSAEALRAARLSGVGPLVCAQAGGLPFPDGSFATVLAGDLFHHLDDEGLALVLREVRRVLLDGGRLVAWWYERSGRPGPDAPAHPRTFDVAMEAAAAAGLAEPRLLPLETTLDPAPPTIGLVAAR